MRHLQDQFAEVENVTGKRFPAFEKWIEKADVEAQRDYYRLMRIMLQL